MLSGSGDIAGCGFSEWDRIPQLKILKIFTRQKVCNLATGNWKLR